MAEQKSVRHTEQVLGLEDCLWQMLLKAHTLYARTTDLTKWTRDLYKNSTHYLSDIDLRERGWQLKGCNRKQLQPSTGDI